MAFYHDSRFNDIIFSEHEFYGGNIQFPRHLRPQAAQNALGLELINDFPNIYGDLYELSMQENAMREAQGLPVKKDKLWEVDHFKEVRAARDRGDRSDKSIWPTLGYGGYAVDANGFNRSICFEAFARVSDPLMNFGPPGPWNMPFFPGAKVTMNGMPIFHPW